MTVDDADRSGVQSAKNSSTPGVSLGLVEELFVRYFWPLPGQARGAHAAQ
jgi:hypothetical protein